MEVHPTGGEHLAEPSEKAQFAIEAVQKAAHPLTDPDLAMLVAAWANLSDPIKAGLLALVRAAGA